MEHPMLSTRPYLIRAFYEWIVDSGLTPFVVIDVTKPFVEVPSGYAEDDKIVLNVSEEAVKNLILGDQYIEFEASFSGQPLQITAPVVAVMAIYAKENGKGMVFSDEEEGEGAPPPPPRRSPNTKPKLKIVK